MEEDDIDDMETELPLGSNYTKRKADDHHLLNFDLIRFEEDESEIISVQQKIKRMKIPSFDLTDMDSENDTEFEISVKTLTGRSLEINVHNFSTIQEIKQKLLETQGIPVDQQRLIYNGRTMSEERRVIDYKLTSSSILHLVLALRGGIS